MNRRDRRRYYFRYFIILCVIIFLSLTLFFFAGIRFLEMQKISELKEEQHRKVLSEQYFFEHTFRESVYDLKVMADNLLFREVITGNNKDEMMRAYLEGLVTDLLRQKRNYYQFRFLNKEGAEVFRMEREQGMPVMVPPDRLQDKSRRYYFREAIKLEEGSIYVSPFDLNVENEELEKPLRPMIRICTPVFYSEEKIGINVLNCDGSSLLAAFQGKASQGTGGSYLLNRDGYFLSAPDSLLAWGFMFPGRTGTRISDVFGTDAGLIEKTAQGQFKTENGLYTVATIYPFGKAGLGEEALMPKQDYSWKLLSFVPESKMSFAFFMPSYSLWLFYLFALLVGGVFASFYSRLAVRKYQAMQDLVQSEKNLREANRVKNQFFSILSHDLKNISGSLSSYLELICDGYDSFEPEERKTHLDTVAHAASMLTRLLYDILEWARLQQDKVKIKPEELDVAVLFEEQKNQKALALTKKELMLELSVEAGLKVFADQHMVKTILRNLLDNAVKFSFRGGRIVLSGVRIADETEFRVTDFGTGMDETKRKRIFDLDARVQMPGTEQEEGTGFGLKLVLELVRKNKGSLHVESEPGRGSCFIVRLPACSGLSV
ncbi:MAG: ATP-binding protein [Mangrovibacterium sp.]